MNISYQNKNHSDVETSHLVWRIANKARDEEFQVYKENRIGNSKIKAVVNALATGEVKLKSSSLATFNRKICAMVEGRMYEEEEGDTLPPVSLDVSDLDPNYV